MAPERASFNRCELKPAEAATFSTSIFLARPAPFLVSGYIIAMAMAC
jgi:predicted LPLAT superfamily acyltransferase